MACGAPVIASDVGGLSFIVRDGETGFLIPERNIDALAEKMLLLLSRPELRDELGARGVEIAQDYAWSRIADQILVLYREVQRSRGEERSTIVRPPVPAESTT